MRRPLHAKRVHGRDVGSAPGVGRTLPGLHQRAKKFRTAERQFSTRRAQTIAFTAAYAEIESTYLVPAGSPIKSIADVDKPGIRIASCDYGSTWALWGPRRLEVVSRQLA